TTWPAALAAEPAAPGNEPAAPGNDIDLLDLGVFKLRGFDDAERLFQLVAPELERNFPRPRTPGAPTNNLPAPVTSFLGRRAEIRDLTELIGPHRLVTVAGAGGAGKTRLALAAAEMLLTGYPDGVWQVDAAATPMPAADAVAAALGLRPEPGRPVLETIAEQCAGHRMLLVVDTCDAQPGAVADVVRKLLATCPRVDVLTTSRQPLGIAGEVVWRIPPMAAADAFELLMARTTEARGGRVPAREEHADLARVVSGLDGSPLAVELAAARLRLLSGGQLAGRLDDPVGALDAGRAGATDRHGSMTANLDWSYRTLSSRAGGLLQRLSVFAGPVDLAAVEWCGDDTLAGLTELADKSLVEVLPGPSVRLPATIRGYANRHLVAAGGEGAARDRHVAWALHTLDGVAVDVDGQPRTVSLTELAPHVAEWQAALRWAATDGHVRSGLRLAQALDPWWREHGGAGEGRDLLYRLYGRMSGEHIAPAELGSAYLVHAGLAGDHDERDRFLRRAEEVARRADDPGLLVRALAGHRVGLLERRDEAGLNTFNKKCDRW
ncbi:adenylate/guanylate cyclase domain-containing protein, partial [Actinoplanes sp. NPDC051633]